MHNSLPTHTAADAADGDAGETQRRWDTWGFAFVTLWSGKASGERVLDWLATATVPPNSVLYWVDNSGGLLTETLRAAWKERLHHRFRKLEWLKCGEPYRSAPGEALLHPGRHRQVARLYNVVFPRVFEEIVVTLEDDIVPPLDGVRSLLSLMDAAGRVGVAAGAYRDRIRPMDICAARSKRLWLDVPRYDALPAGPFEVGKTGGGFALMLNRALQQVLPVRCTVFGQGVAGWDGYLCNGLTSLGYRLMLHPGVRCAHLCPEVSAYESTLNRV